MFPTPSPRSFTTLSARGLLAASLCLASACAKDDDPVTMVDSAVQTPDGGAPEGDAAVDLPEGCKQLVNDKDCDKTKRPIVFVHGTVANGDSFEYPAKLLASNGYCPEWIRAVEYHSLVALVPDGGAGTDAGAAPLPPADAGGDAAVADAGSASDAATMDAASADAAAALDAATVDAAATGEAGVDAARPPGLGFMLDSAETYRRASLDIDRVIEELRKETGFDKVDLAGHSQGSGHGATYAGMHPDKVAHYVHLAGRNLTADPGGVPTLCVSSIGDNPVMCSTTANVQFQDQELDHAAVSSSTESTLEIYKFLNNGEEAKVKEVACGRPIIIEGRAPTFADNIFLVGAKVEIFELDYSKPARERGTPAASYTLTANGKFGPFEAKPGVAYEFTLTPVAGDTRRISHQYMAPFTRTDRLLRTTFETKDPVASATNIQVNRHDGIAVIIPRTRQKGFLFPRDSLKVNGREVLSRATTWNDATNKSTVTAAYYLYDKSLTAPAYGPGDGQTTGESIVRGTFVNSADVYMQAATPEWITLEFNGTTLKIPNWPSVSVGTSIVQVN